jgi:hypothetical protein
MVEEMMGRIKTTLLLLLMMMVAEEVVVGSHRII